MAMGAPWGMTIFMAIEADRLRLAQLLSPAFPIGAFAHSQGLEAAISAGLVTDEASLRDWIEGVVLHGSGRMDAIFLTLARAPGADLPALADLARAYMPSLGRAREAEELGRAFGAQMAAITGQESPLLPLPLAIGLATREQEVGDGEVLALWLQGLAAQLVSVAVRFMPLGQSAGQRLISGLAPLIVQAAADYARLGLDDLGSCTIGADIASMTQETLEVRIFRS